MLLASKLNFSLLFLGLSVLILGKINSSQANDNILLGDITYEGSACPQGSISINLNNHQGKLSFETLNMSAKAGSSTQKEKNLTECTISIPVHVAKGYRVALAPIHYNGKVSLPYGTYGRLFVNYYFRYPYGIAQQNFRNIWNGEQIEEFSILAPRSSEEATFYSNCGESFRLEMDLALMAQTNRFNHDASITLNQINNFEFKIEKCEP